MTTSGTASFAMNRDEIIIDALENIGALGVGEVPDAAQISMCARKLNMMVKAWMAQGVHLWALKEATLFLSVGTPTYSLGSTGTHCTDTYVHTTLSTNEATNSTSLGITSATGMSANDFIGIVLDDGTIHWTTISGAPGTTTTIATGLASAATAGNVVFAYTTKINRPQRIQSAYRRNIDNFDLDLEELSREDYASLSNKFIQGKPIKYCYDPQLTNGILSVWLTPDIATDVIRFWYERPLQDFNAATDNPDFPIEWAEALSAGLSLRIARPYGLTLQEIQSLEQQSAIKLDIALGYGIENVSVMFQPNSQ
ncbi:MAG: hypothetical protein ACXWJZ_01265 [Burkholderiaceae bacterium]